VDTVSCVPVKGLYANQTTLSGGGVGATKRTRLGESANLRGHLADAPYELGPTPVRSPYQNAAFDYPLPIVTVADSESRWPLARHAESALQC
jgi:hypothetical protein